MPFKRRLLCADVCRQAVRCSMDAIALPRRSKIWSAAAPLPRTVQLQCGHIPPSPKYCRRNAIECDFFLNGRIVIAMSLEPLLVFNLCGDRPAGVL
jgi:hypothetical protein